MGRKSPAETAKGLAETAGLVADQTLWLLSEIDNLSDDEARELRFVMQLADATRVVVRDWQSRGLGHLRWRVRPGEDAEATDDGGG